MVGRVDDASGGHFGKDVAFALFSVSGEERHEALAVEDRGGLAAGRFDEGGDDIGVFDERVVDRAGCDFAGPADDEAGMKPGVVEGPFGEGEAGALLGGGDEERVVGDFVFVDEVESLANLTVEVGDLCQIAGHGVARFGRIHKSERQLDLIERILAGVAFVPGSVWLVGSEEKTEGRVGFATAGDERFDGFEVWIGAIAQVFEGED